MDPDWPFKYGKPATPKPQTARRAPSASLTEPKLFAKLRDRRRSATGTDNTSTNTHNKEGNTMPTATAKVSTRKSTRKPAASKVTTKVAVQLKRGKFNKDGSHVEAEPTGSGGVRFSVDPSIKEPAITTVYLAQKQDKAMGSPATITVTIEPAA